MAKRDGYTLKGLQVDILRNEGHNLHKEEVWNWVSQQLQSGLVDLFLVAPPCNTHSRARCQYRQHGGPRPLRNYNFPHGFPWLSQANMEKVRLADELVQKSLHGCAVVLAHGGHFFLEHPEQLGVTAGQIPASIWDLPEVAELLCQTGKGSACRSRCFCDPGEACATHACWAPRHFDVCFAWLVALCQNICQALTPRLPVGTCV